MEDILSSIKRIIAEDGAAVSPVRPRRPVADPAGFVAYAEPEPAPAPVEILELTEPAPPLMSPDAAVASKQSLDMLSSLMTRGNAPAATPAAPDNPLEAVVKDMLRPMLKDWLDERLPEMVEALVAREIARITGQQG